MKCQVDYSGPYRNVARVTAHLRKQEHEAGPITAPAHRTISSSGGGDVGRPFSEAYRDRAAGIDQLKRVHQRAKVRSSTKRVRPDAARETDALEGARPVSHRTIEEMSYGGCFADLEPRDATAPVEGLSE